MRKNRVFRTLILALLLATALCLPAGAFSAEPSGWAAEQCRHLEEVGLLTWDLYTSSTAPTDCIRRGDFCQMLVNLIQMEGDWEKLAKVEPVPDGFFTDAASADAAYGMYYGAAYGITEGASRDGQRVADAYSNLTREQAAKMMCALIDALETYGGVPAPQEGAAKTFADQDKISAWAAEYVARASALGILQGDNAGKFNPKGNLTWQEACVMVDRVYCSAEAAVRARRAEQGIHMMDTGFELYADKYLRQSVNRLYALEYNGRQSVLAISSDGIQVESYNADGASAGIKTIPSELSICGGFYEGPDNYYLAFGQENMEESASKTVYRVVKYDKSWNRLGAADISDCYTTVPFDFTSHTAMAEEDGTLILHTSRQRYLTGDGLRHQSNFTAKIRTSDMAVIYQSPEQDRVNYTSHSFAQYASFDNGLPVYVDHGDAYPRSFCLSTESAQGGGRQQSFFPFSGGIGDNTTNAVPGGLGVSAGNYLFAAASSPQQGNDSLQKANAFLAVIPKSGGQAQIKWLTSLPSDGSAFVNDVRLVEVNNNTFVVMWQVTHPGKHFYKFDELQYAVFDGQGDQVGETKSLPGYIAPSMGTDPAVYGTRILWAKAELDVSDRYTTRKSRYVQIFELDIDPNAASESPSSTAPSAGTGDQAPGTGARPDDSYPTVGCVVNDISITRTDVPDQGLSSYYREDWDGNWMEVSVEGNTFTFSGCIQESGYTQALLSVAASPSIFITQGQPFSVSTQAAPSDLTGGRNISVGVAGDGAGVWITFRSGVSLKAVLDGSGSPALQVSLPFWLRDGGSTPGSSNAPGTPAAPNTSEPPRNPGPSSEQPGGVEYIKGVICTKLPADGVVTSYREEYSGTWLQIDVVNGSTIQFTGCGELSNAYYNYAVIRAFGSQAETPYYAGTPFSVSVTVNAAGLAAAYESDGGPYMLMSMVCQNYRPGDSAFAGYGFQSGSDVALVPDGNGGIAFRVTR